MPPAAWSMSRKATESREYRSGDRADALPQWRRKSERACCAKTRDALGRLCIGWCGPRCEGRR